MPGLYTIAATDASVGGTAGTFDAVNTRNANVLLRAGTTALVGIQFGGTPATQTTALPEMGILRITAADLGIAAEDFMVGNVHGGGIATQSGAWMTSGEYMPVDWKASAGSTVNFYFSQAAGGTDAWSVVVGASHVAGAMPPAPWFQAAIARSTLPAQTSRAGAGSGALTTATRTTMGAVTIDGRCKSLVGFRPNMAQLTVPTTAEEYVAFWELTSTIGDFAPQEYVGPSIGPALAGTLVGGGSFGYQDPLPAFILKDGNTQTIEPFINPSTTTTGSWRAAYSISGRY